MQLRNRSNTIRPFSSFEKQLDAYWKRIAESTRDNIQVVQLPKGSNYDVESNIYNQFGQVIASGQYNGSSGQHAEIGALDNCPPTHNGRLTVNPPPCKRCAAVLYYYRTRHGFTICAPERAFAKNYTGAYHLPDFIKDDVIIEGVINEGIMSRVEALHHKQSILTRFCGYPW